MTLTTRSPHALRIAFVAALVAVFVVALLPTTYEPKILSWQDKIEHFVIFGALTLLGSFAWPRPAVAVPAGILVYGAAIEIAQSFTTYRTGDIRDWIADALGVAIAALVARLLSRPRQP